MECIYPLVLHLFLNFAHAKIDTNHKKDIISPEDMHIDIFLIKQMLTIPKTAFKPAINSVRNKTKRFKTKCSFYNLRIKQI